MTAGGDFRGNRRKHLVFVARPTVRDARLSFRALGVLVWLLAQPEGWEPDVEQVADSRGTPEEIDDALREAEAAGYLTRDGSVWYLDDPWQEQAAPAGRPQPAQLHWTGPVVYYAQRDNHDIKIGFTGHLASRLRTLEKEHGALALLAQEPGGWHHERERHREFDHLRLSTTGEWFRPGLDLLQHIQLVMEGGLR